VPATGGGMLKFAAYAPGVYRPAAALTSDFAKAGLTVQLCLVGELDTHLADEAGAAYSALSIFFRSSSLDGTHVADGRERPLLERIVAGQTRLMSHAAKLIAMHGKARHLLFIEL